MRDEFNWLHIERMNQARQVAQNYNYEMDSYLSTKQELKDYLQDNRTLMSFFAKTELDAAVKTSLSNESSKNNLNYQDLPQQLHEYVLRKKELEAHLGEFRMARAAKDRFLQEGHQLEIGPSIEDTLPLARPILISN